MSSVNSTALSIIIPIYNAESYVIRCLDSIIMQAEKLSENTVEVICVDDGSKDESLSILNNYATEHERVRVIHEENAGPAAARNAGLDMARGEWIWFVDPDDYVDENAVENILSLISDDMDDQLVESSPCLIDFNTKRAALSDVIMFDAYEHKTMVLEGGCPGKDNIRPWEHFSEDHVFTEEADLCAIQRLVLYPYVSGSEESMFDSKGIKAYSTPIAAPWDKLYRRQFLTGNGLRFNENLRVLDDMFFNIQAFGATETVAYSKKKIYHYIRNSRSITATYTPDRIEKDRVVWKAIEEYIDGLRDGDSELKKTLNKRIIKSFAIALKLSLFNTNNPKDIKNQMQEAREVLDIHEYKEAFGSVKLGEVEWRLRPVIICARIGWMSGLWLLTKMQEKI
ncbi:MAG: glycosyltransferase family 2 protein [Lachnospiraceae bacterium]|nr:glycosyltransferase family 2 protein [Lachnospiraceae bacterium]